MAKPNARRLASRSVIDIDSSDDGLSFYSKSSAPREKPTMKLSNGNPFLNKMIVPNPFNRAANSTSVSVSS